MNSVIIVAGGSGSRMNMNINKQFIKINEKEVIAHTIDKFYKNEYIDEIILVVKEDEIDYFNKNIINKYGYKNIKVALGGKERQDSVYNGLKIVDKNCDMVLVHDGARPFVSKEIIKKAVTETKKASVIGVRVKDTIKVVNNNEIISTPNRNTLWAIQTPQTFKYDLLKIAYEKAYEENFYGTDDSSLVENLGEKVNIIEGSYENIKITTKEDLNMAYQIIKE